MIVGMAFGAWSPHFSENIYIYVCVCVICRSIGESTETDMVRSYESTEANGTRIIRIILGMASASKRRRYNVTSSLTGWAHIQNKHIQCTLLIYALHT